MQLQKIMIALAAAALLGLAWRAYGWPGIAVAASGIVMWLLLNVTRTLTVLQRAAKQPIGWLASAVMLNARLKPGLTLLHVIAQTRALGQLLSQKDEQPEIYRWTDNGGSHVTCEFNDGKLKSWQLARPPEAPDAAATSAPALTSGADGRP